MTEPYQNRYLAMPGSGKGPGVLVLHAWWGLNDTFKKFCDRLAQQGFVVLAPDMFSGKIARTVEEAEQLTTQSSEERDVPPILLSAVDELNRLSIVNGKGLGIVGFSFGAYWALWLASQKPEAIRAVSLFYGTGEGDFQQSQAAFQGHFAANDPYESEEGVNALEKMLRDADRPTSFYTYPGTGHWFFEEDRQDAYNAPAAQLAWERTAAFLHEQLDGASA